jgi:hypothetical protein
MTSKPLDDGERRRVLIEEFGYSEAIVAQLPADDPMPARDQSRSSTRSATSSPESSG